MPQPRHTQVSLSETPYYHVISRCVRRTFLCGIDYSTGQSYEHRRADIENRLRLLSSIFTVDICAYAVMSNHYHLVLKLNPSEAQEWSMKDVLQHWSSLFKGPLLVQRYLTGKVLSGAEREALFNLADLYHQRLTDLSWFMKCLNEPIARQANKEDGCTGHFWESRFKCQPLLSEEALLSCMVYVDLNPIRAGMAETPENSCHTSIQERVKPQFNLADAIHGQVEYQSLQSFALPLKPLLDFTDSETEDARSCLPFRHNDYLALVDRTGRTLQPDKRGSISITQLPILERLNMETSRWFTSASEFEAHYRQWYSRRAHNASPKVA